MAAMNGSDLRLALPLYLSLVQFTFFILFFPDRMDPTIMVIITIIIMMSEFMSLLTPRLAAAARIELL